MHDTAALPRRAVAARPLRVFRARAASLHAAANEHDGDHNRAQHVAPVRVTNVPPLCTSHARAALDEVAVGDVMQLVRRLDTTALTNVQAEAIASPYHEYTTSKLLSALHERLTCSVAVVRWHTPRSRHEWHHDLRFRDAWWLTLRSGAARAVAYAALMPPTSVRDTVGDDGSDNSDGDSRIATNVDATPTARLTRYGALLPEGERHSVTAQQQLVSDLAQHMRDGGLRQCTLLHIDELPLTPDRMHVLVYHGMLAHATSVAVMHEARECTSTDAAALVIDELTTVSFSMCSLDSASLLVLLTALASTATPHLTTLDLSHNMLTAHSLPCLARLLARTSIARLSLRGNCLAGDEAACVRDFLLDGAAALEELDLAYTTLTSEQVHVLIECLPQLPRLRVLLLDGVAVAPAVAPALARAVRRSSLRCVSLHGCLPTNAAVYSDLVAQACRRDSDGKTTVAATSFFEHFFRRARAMGCTAADTASLNACAALPCGYRPFTNNDPSLAQ